MEQQNLDIDYFFETINDIFGLSLNYTKINYVKLVINYIEFGVGIQTERLPFKELLISINNEIIKLSNIDHTISISKRRPNLTQEQKESILLEISRNDILITNLYNSYSAYIRSQLYSPDTILMKNKYKNWSK
jgi:hypothetical protein